MKNSNVTDLVQVNKAVLTPTAIKCLEGLQSENNNGITAIREDIADVVCFLGRYLNAVDEDFNVDANNAINALSITRKTINELKKP